MIRLPLKKPEKTEDRFFYAWSCAPFSTGTPLFAYEITEKLSIGGVLAGIYQYESLSDAPGYESEGRGLLAFQPQISFTPTDQDELFAKFGFGVGDGLMGDGISPL